MDNKKQTYFVRKMFFSLLLPSLISSIGLSLGGIADALFVGGRLGESGLAAVGFACPAYMIFNTFGVALGVGGSIHYTRMMSGGDRAGANKLFTACLGTAIALGLIFAALGNTLLNQLVTLMGADPGNNEAFAMTSQYVSVLLWFAPVFMINMVLYYFVRSDDDPSLATAGLIIGNIIDISLNYIMIYLLDMGITGAVWSTVIGTALSVLIYLPHFFKKRTLLRVAARAPKLRELLLAFRTGFASSMQYVCQFIMLIVLNNVLMNIGGEGGVAIYDVLLNVSYIIFGVYEGTSAAMQPVLSTFYGEKNYSCVKHVLQIVAISGAAISIPILCAAFAMPEAIGTLFGLSGETLNIGAQAIRIFCVSVIPGGLLLIMSSYYQSVDEERTAYMINMLRSFAMPLAFGLVCAFMGIYRVWWMLPAAELSTTAILLTACLLKGSFFRLKDIERSRVLEFTVRDCNEDISRITSRAGEFCEELGGEIGQSYYVSLTIEEICGAIIANAFDGKDDYIQITLVAGEDGTFTLHMRDSASSFNPFELELSELSQDNDSGLDSIGVLMVKKKAKSWFYRRYRGFNTLVITV